MKTSYHIKIDLCKHYFFPLPFSFHHYLCADLQAIRKSVKNNTITTLQLLELLWNIWKAMIIYLTKECIIQPKLTVLCPKRDISIININRGDFSVSMSLMLFYACSQNPTFLISPWKLCIFSELQNEGHEGLGDMSVQLQ